ncbi:MAG: F-box protein [Kistimonas sp.]|nr:F-box protein [Kistimonas sp.]
MQMPVPVTRLAPGSAQPEAGPAQPETAATFRLRVTDSPPGARIPVIRSQVEPRPAVTHCLAGHSIAHWPDHLLELVLYRLGPADLARSGRVCHRWYRLTSDPELQARSFMRDLPSLCWRQLKQALAPSHGRQSLLDWRERLAVGTLQRAALERLALRELSARGLFCALLKQRLVTQRFSACELRTIDYRGMLILDLVCSPDGQYLAHCSRISRQDSPICISVCHYDLGALRQRGYFSYSHSFHSLRFSADSRRLEAVDPQGHLHGWQPDPHGQWHSLGSSLLSSSVVTKVVTSLDYHYMAIADDEGGLSVFGNEHLSCWQQQWNWLAPDGEPPQGLIELTPDIMVFSRNSQFFLFVSGWRAHVCRRRGTGWEAHEFADVRACIRQGAALAPAGDCLALCSTAASQPCYTEGTGTVGLWKFREPQGWQYKTGRPCRYSIHGFAMTFSPDGQQLACADGLSTGDSRLFILSTTGSEGWTVATELEFGSGPRFTGRLCHLVESLQFSATGYCLAATARSGVHIWRQDLTQGWVSAAWVANDGCHQLEAVQTVFSPDGYHCALAMGSHSQVSVWGPGPGGRYSRKLHLVRNASAGPLMFTPDASQLVIVSSDHWTIGASQGLCKLDCVPLLPPAAVSDGGRLSRHGDQRENTAQSSQQDS